MDLKTFSNITKVPEVSFDISKGIDALFVEYLSTSYERIEALDGNKVLFIEGGESHRLAPPTYQSLLEKWTALEKALERGCAIKVEGLEISKNLSNLKNIFGDTFDAHAFISKKGSKSFPPHKDNVNVILYIVKGTKYIYTREGSERTILSTGECALIPKGCYHEVQNVSDNIAISFGVFL